MKKEFVLPKYWYLKIEPDNIDLIQKWRKREFNFESDISNYYFVDQNGVGAGRRWRGDFLSTKQFITHVLKENINEEIKEENYKPLIDLLIKLGVE